MDVVMSSPDKGGRRITVLRRPDGLFTYRIDPGSPDELGGIYDTAEKAMQEALSSPRWLDPYLGMTVNERLFAADLQDAFDSAIGARDSEAAIYLLEQTNLPRAAAEATVAAILAPR